MKILITGGLGQIGSYLAEKLTKEHQVTIIDDMSHSAVSKISHTILIKGDISNKLTISKVPLKPDIIIHCAAQIDVSQSTRNPILDAKTNILGIINILEYAKESHAKVIYFSSAAVYGHPESLPISEAHNTDPISPYGISKLAGEYYVCLYYHTHKVQSVILRPFNIYSPRETSSVIARFLHGTKPVIYGSGNQTRDFVSAKDVVNVTIEIIESDISGETINIGTGKATSINEVAEILEITPEYRSAKDGDIQHSVADITKLQELINFKPGISLKTDLKREMLKYH